MEKSYNVVTLILYFGNGRYTKELTFAKKGNQKNMELQLNVFEKI